MGVSIGAYMGKPGEGTMAFVTSRADALWPEGRVPYVITAGPGDVVRIGQAIAAHSGSGGR